MQNRRDFLKLAGLAAGGVILSSCGGSGGASARPVPGGFRFYRLRNVGDQLPGGRTIADMPGSAMISSVNTIIFHAKDSSGAMGCYELTVDYGGSRPTVASMRKIVRDGDVLGDGRQVAKVTPGDMNKAGAYASVLRLQGEDVVGLYLDSNGSGMHRVVGYQDTAVGVDGFIGQSMGDVDLHDNNDILCVAHFGNRRLGRPQVGLFHIPRGLAGPAGALVASSGDLVPGAGGLVRSFGLIDMNDGGHYVTQAIVTAMRTATASGAAGERAAATALLAGNISQRGPARIITASRDVRLSPAARIASSFTSAGEVIYGPRLGAQQNVAHIVHTSNNSMILYYEDAAVVATGRLSPRGDLIISIGPPVVGDDGLIYFSLFTDAGVELCIASGAAVHTILGSGDIMPHDDDGVVSRFIFGAMNKQVDTKGRITFIADYKHFNAQVSAVVVGLPV